MGVLGAWRTGSGRRLFYAHKLQIIFYLWTVILIIHEYVLISESIVSEILFEFEIISSDRLPHFWGFTEYIHWLILLIYNLQLTDLFQAVQVWALLYDDDLREILNTATYNLGLTLYICVCWQVYTIHIPNEPLHLRCPSYLYEQND